MRAQAVGAGIGEVSDRQIQQRAQELAVQEGRPTVTSDLLARARNELTQSVSPVRSDDDLASLSDEARAPEDAVGSSGRKVKNRGPEDEANIPKTLTEEGVAEADHERTVVAEKMAERRSE